MENCVAIGDRLIIILCCVYKHRVVKTVGMQCLFFSNNVRVSDSVIHYKFEL